VFLTYLQAIVLGFLQGITELFPISSLGHSVLLPAWLGGSWQHLVEAQSAGESPYLAFLVGLHVATGLALLIMFRKDWAAIIRGFFSSLRTRSVAAPEQRLAWLIVLATIPAGLIGLALEHSLRTLFADPKAAAVLLTINGVILGLGEVLRRRAPQHRPVDDADVERAHLEDEADVAIGQQVSTRDALVIGVAQSAALMPGISRSGITMVGGLLRGLTHEEAVRFSFLLATPIIFAAGVYRVPDLMGSLGDGIRGQVLAGSVAAFIGAWIAAKFLQRWFTTRTLTPFAIYCLIVGTASIVKFA
jgi:undecaprenyl-diphosphatase